MNQRGKLFSTFFFAAAIASLLLFQNCSQVHYALTGDQSSSSPKVPELAVSEGGEIYDGKPRILHHYAPGFQCEGRTQPESILISRDDTTWFLTQNTREKCAIQDRVVVTDVVYNSATNQASYQGKTYVPPIPFYVDASEDPNLPDKLLDDGVCENVNNKCSLLAAVQQAGVVSYTSNTVVEIPSATYKLTTYLDIRTSTNNNSIHLRGDPSGSKPILDGQGQTNPLYLVGRNGTVIIDQLRFINGFVVHQAEWGPSPLGSAITVDSTFRGAITILDSEFLNNKNSSAVHIGPGTGQVIVQRSIFSNNDGNALRAFGPAGFLVEDSIFTDNGAGITVHTLSNVTIDRSTFTGQAYSAISLGHCRNCKIRNSTIYNNSGRGLILNTNPWLEPEASPTIINSTILQNGNGSVPNIQISFQNSLHKLKLQNSVIATNGLGNSNCEIVEGASYFYDIESVNSFFDDTTCRAAGGNNIIEPLLLIGSFGNHGGLTPTWLPLSGSPLIDAGDNNLCPTSDQRGQPRPIDKLGAGPRCDIGAVEVQQYE